MTGYLKSGELDSAWELYSRMEKKQIFTWNAIIIGFIQGGRAKEASDFFHELLSLSKGGVWPDKITIPSVLSACTQLGAIEQGTCVHNYLREGYGQISSRSLVYFRLVLNSELLSRGHGCIIT
ncbi:hypothetical protein ACFE04_012841 [Oxalis oulophora]